MCSYWVSGLGATSDEQIKGGGKGTPGREGGRELRKTGMKMGLLKGPIRYISRVQLIYCFLRRAFMVVSSDSQAEDFQQNVEACRAGNMYLWIFVGMGGRSSSGFRNTKQPRL